MTASNRRVRPERPRRRRVILKLLCAVVTIGLILAASVLPLVGGIGVAVNAATDQFLDTSCDVALSPTQQTTTVLASDGKTVIATLFEQNRKDIALSRVPKHVQQALVSTEDRRFYEHHGVDMRSLLRAAVHNVAGEGSQGGSTLTMQLVKQERYYQAKTDAERESAVSRDVRRKLQDAKCALGIEKRHTKSEILDDYLNTAFFGENSYGIETAAHTYFDKPAARLTVPEGATLIGLVRSPTAYDPFLHPLAARERRNEVLMNMAATGDLSQARAAKYAARPIRLATTTPPPVQQGCVSPSPAIANVGFFCDYAVNWLRSHGVSQRRLLTGGLRVVTTLDARLQSYGQRAIWRAGLDPKSPTALVMPAVDPNTGAVRTMISSRRFGLAEHSGESVLPLFSAGYAGAGSTYKYFTTLAALKLGIQPNFSLTTGSAYTVRNCPLDPNSNDVPYTTHNAGTYVPTLKLSDALPQSVNTYFVGLEDQFFGCELTPIVRTALGLGMTTLNRPQSTETKQSIAQAVMTQHQAGFTLGFSPTSALELTAAYGAVANDGVYCPPVPIARVTTPNGSPVPFRKPHCSRQFDRQVARTMVKMLTVDTTNAEGTAASYFRDWYGSGGSPVASKTGTDNDDINGPNHGKGNSALWFVGVTPGLVSAAALINPISPKATVTGLPRNVTTNGSDIFGAYASTFWLAAYGPTLRQHPWAWRDPAAIPGAVRVPDPTGRSAGAAAAQLSAAGFRTSIASLHCGSPQPYGDVGYYEPHLARRGSTITLCISNGITPTGYFGANPPAPPAPNPAPPRASRPQPPKPAPQPPPHTKKPRPPHRH